METNQNKIKNKNKIKNNIKNLPIDTQIYLKNNASITEYNYYKNQNDKLLPITSIIDYMAKNFNTFYEKFKKKRTDGGFGETIILNDIFVIPPVATVPDQNGNFSFTSTSKFVQNPDITFDYFISLLDWNLSNSKEQNYKKQDINKLGISESIKNQVGKDIFRLGKNSLLINNKVYEGIDNLNKYENTDIFNETIMNVMNNAGILIDLNNINIIDIFIQQNIGNFLSMAITLFASYLIPGNEIINENGDLKYLFISTNYTVKKEIILNKVEQKILLSGGTELYLEGEIAGNFSFILNIDLKNKKYSLDNFTLNFNVENIITPNTNSSDNLVESVDSSLSNINNKAYNFINKHKGKIAAGVAVSGLASVGALYLAGILGGKSKKLQRSKKLKTKKLQQSKIKNKYLRNKSKKQYYNRLKKQRNKKNKTMRSKTNFLASL